MTHRRARLWLWIAFAFSIPLPFYLMLPGFVPWARLFMFSLVHIALAVTEGVTGAIALAVGMLILQTLVYAALLWLAAHLAARLLGHLASLAPATWALIATLVLTASVFDLYHMPFRADSSRGNLLAVFD